MFVYRLSLLHATLLACSLAAPLAGDAAAAPADAVAAAPPPIADVFDNSAFSEPLYHGKKFLDAVKANKPNVEWLVYQEEGHGWTLPKNRIDFWGQVEKFLGRHIGTP